MRMRDFLENWGLSSLKLNLGFLETEFNPNDPDRGAAWDLYVELLTRITTQALSLDGGDEKAALDSIYAIFPLTREILKKHGSGAGNFAKLSIPILNQVIRPFTARWHRRALAGDLASAECCAEFRRELSDLQVILRRYTNALASMAAVEDLTSLEEG